MARAAPPRDWTDLARVSLTAALTRLGDGAESFTARQEGVESARARAFSYRQAARLKQARKAGKAFATQAGTETRYAGMHQTERARRFQAARGMDAIRAVSPLGGHWYLGPTSKHSAGCLAMAGSNWSWKVLDKINPAREHAGCLCYIGSWLPDAPHGSARAAKKFVAEIDKNDVVQKRRNVSAARQRGPLPRPPTIGQPFEERAWNPAFHPRWLRGKNGGQFRVRSGGIRQSALALLGQGSFSRSRSADVERLAIVRANLGAHGIELPKQVTQADALKRMGLARKDLAKGVSKEQAIVIRRDLSPVHVEKVAQFLHEATNNYAEAMEVIVKDHGDDVERWGSFYVAERRRLKSIAAEHGFDWRKVVYMASALSPQKDWNPEWQYGPIGITKQMLADADEWGAPDPDRRGYAQIPQFVDLAVDSFQGKRWNDDDLVRQSYAAPKRKIRNFAKAIIGDETAVVIDIQMLKLAFPDQPDPQHPANYQAATLAVERLAEQTGVSPATVQAVLWGYAREVKYPRAETNRLRRAGQDVGGSSPSARDRERRAEYQRELKIRRKKGKGVVAFALRESTRVVDEMMGELR